MASIQKYKNKKGKQLYKFKIYLGTDPITNKQITTTRRGFTSIKAAKSAARKLQTEFEEQGWGSDNTSDIRTFQQLFDVWFENYQLSVKKSTATDSWQIYKRYIKPKFGSSNIQRINVLFCQKCVNYWYKNYREARHIKNTVSQILRYGISLEIIDENPMAKVTLPRPLPKRDNSNNYYSKEELKHFFDSLNDIGDLRYIAFFRFLAYTGVRKSEALALQWKDFNFKNNTVKISKTIYYDARLKRVIVQEPKTKSSNRVLDLDPKTVSIMQSWRADQQKRFIKIGINVMNTKQYVFTQEKSNRLLVPNSVNDWLKWIYKKHPQKKITVHGFRHTHASLLFEAGATIKEVQERLGHSNSKTTLDIYTHVVKEKKKETALKFADFADN
ncbi:tyrosine-type recombinase/integrase [Ligilactobacillus pobuzihii]|uniref:tyrosine-type recombinase/integrase n=1 Tax=Ligilactobacillus pobuzihii TaxID=449659 RepID=UPI0019D0DDA6|nr:site-specific integrase [Ligilactobacillus pobuzihii]MBN7273690.1 tyrosine-type recombinase/integrase [Ligilactobacillus pobuzihii]